MRAQRLPPDALNESARAAITLIVFFLIKPTETVSPDHDILHLPDQESLRDKQIELFDGVNLKFPQGNDTSGKLLSLEVNTNGKLETTGRGKQNKLLQRILPLFIMPFLIQSTIVPFFLSTLKFMLFKSVMVGKIALALIIFNAFRNHNNFKSRQDEVVANSHYGYHGDGMEEYGAYINS